MAFYLNKKTICIQYQKRRFQAKIWATLGVCTIVVLLSLLAVWQWHRAEQKRQLMTDHKAKWHKPATPFHAFLIGKERKHFEHIQVQGHFDLNHSLLLDHQTHYHQPGYHLIVPFHLDQKNASVLLVDCGWLPRHKPSLATVEKFIPKTPHQIIKGHLYFIHHRPFRLGHQVLKQDHPPNVIQGIDLPELSAFLKVPLYPCTLLLDENADIGYIKDWEALLQSPARHMGYVFQFASLALLLLIIFISSHTRRVK